MSETWLQSYVYLAFRMDKVISHLYGWPFVTDYYGPPAWKQAVVSEPETAPVELVNQALSLLDTLASQGFSSQRAHYLEKHLVAMETICRKLCGETFSLREEMRRCWDVEVMWTPETVFEQALAIYEAVLPGSGLLPERLSAYEQRCALPVNQRHLLADVAERALAETRKRTLAFTPLPEKEKVTLQWFTERDAPAYAGYVGNYHSLISINPDTAANHLPRLLDHFICHEIYPGHHTESVLKEQELYHKQGSVEASVFLHVSPRNVISEGIAVLAHELIFQPGEAEQWMVAEVYSALHIDVDASVLWQLRQAYELRNGLAGNAALLLDEGQSESEVTRYVAKYTPRGANAASNYVQWLKRPILGYYELIYDCGKRLMEPWLQEPEKQKHFLRFLSEQFVPSQLEKRHDNGQI